MALDGSAPSLPPVEVTPLFTSNSGLSGKGNEDRQSTKNRLVVDASSLQNGSGIRGNGANLSIDECDGGDIVASIVEECDSSDNDKGCTTRKVEVCRMDGTHIASFDLPPDSSSFDERKFWNNSFQSYSGDQDRWLGYQEPIICWASFSRSNGMNNGIRRGQMRKMLCVLGNSSTLLVFDVLGDSALLAMGTGADSGTGVFTAEKNNGDGANEGNDNIFGGFDGYFEEWDDDGGGPGPGGHTVQLPFQARAIYPAGDGRGLLLVRVPSNEDYDDVHEESDLLEGNSLPIQTLHVQNDNLHNEELYDGEEEDDEGFPMLEDPPNLSKKMINCNTPTNLDDPLTVNPAPNSLHHFHNAVPCLFSLRHPLDEFRPVAVGHGEFLKSDTEPHLFGNANVSHHMMNQQLTLFSNVSETLVFVGSPRMFNGASFHQQASVENNGGNDLRNNKFIGTDVIGPLCVTYNKNLGRHAVWTLAKAVSSVPTLPLWKTTGRGNWRTQVSDSENGIDNVNGDEHHAQQVAVGVALDGNDDAKMDEEIDVKANNAAKSLFHESEDQDHLVDANFQPVGVPEGVPSSFSAIHPEIVMKLLYVEESGSSPVGNAFNDDDEMIENQCVQYNHFCQRHIFLATDIIGSGDFTLCIFMPNINSIPGEMQCNEVISEPAILRCYSLHLFRNCNRPVSHLIDLPCSAAQPVKCIPAPLAPFSSEAGGRKTSRFQPADVNTLACDVLVLQQRYISNGDDANNAKETKMSLYRAGALHVVDFGLPKRNEIDGASKVFVGLDNSVGNRVDILYTNGLDNSGVCAHPQIFTMRTSFSLVLQSSPIAETALRAIESSFVNIISSCSAPNSGILFDFHVDESNNIPEFSIAAVLPLLIRADCVRLVQRMWADNESRDEFFSKVDDFGWYSLTVILLNLLLGVNEGHENEEQHTNCSNLQQDGVSDKSTSLAWDDLLQSDFHHTFMQSEGQMLFDDSDLDESICSQNISDFLTDCKYMLSSLNATNQASSDETHRIGEKTSKILQRYRNCIFDSLHLLHEESRLTSQSKGAAWTRRLGTLLLHISHKMTPLMLDFEDHYHRQLGSSRCLSNACDSVFSRPDETTLKHRMTDFSTSPCIMTCLDSIIQLDLNVTVEEGGELFGMREYFDIARSGLNGACAHTWLVLRLFRALFARENTVDLEEEKTNYQTELSFRDRKTVLAMIDEGIFHPIQLQDELPMCVSFPLLETIHRCRLDPPQVESSSTNWIPAAYDLIGRNDLAELLALRIASRKSKHKSSGMPSFASAHGGASKGGNSVVADPDGLVSIEDYSSMIFPSDNRVQEAARLLRTSRPIYLRVQRPVELSDHDYERSKQEKLLLLCRRSISLPLGRGMLTLGTHHSLSSEQLVIPDIVLAGRVPPTNLHTVLDMSSCPPNFRVWPEFHNGVAAGLRLHRAGYNGDRKITRTWIKYNKPVTIQQQDSGNNNGQPQQSYAHGGFLMALGLRGHLSMLTTTDLTDYLTQGSITTTVGIFLGLAANKRGSCDPSVSKMLCLHVPSLLPPSFIPMDLASSVQAAAVAGIGLLYQGSSHRLMTEFLLNEIGRQPIKDQHSNNDREGFSLVCGLALGLVNLNLQQSSLICGIEDLRIEERLNRYIFGGYNGSSFHRHKEGHDGALAVSQSEMDRNARIYESNSINRDITAPGATLALGLMYIKSHNKAVASSLSLPDTHFLLDYVRPDLLALRVISRAIILWDDVEPSSDWIDSNIPSIVKSSIKFMRTAAKKAMSANNDFEEPLEEEEEKSENDVHDFDPQAVRQANAFIIVGSCFSLGLRYAGTANQHAASAIFERVLWLLELRDNKDVVARPDTCTLNTCLCTSAVSLAMVMAGTGDLDAFKLLRALRWRCDDSTLYGSHMAFGAAIGLLFLGGGKLTLGNSPEDVAMLLIAFFPHFPTLSSDNQYHLQALRHLYVLASHERILETVDVDSGEKVCLPIELSLESSNESVEVTTPYLLANETRFTKLQSKSDRYYPIVVSTDDWNQDNLSTLFVKRKPGHLSYLQDPNALRSLSVQSGSVSGASFLKSIKLFSDDAMLTSFATYFCNPKYRDSDSAEIPTSKLQTLWPGVDPMFDRFCNDIAFECMKEEKVGILSFYLYLFNFTHTSNHLSFNIENIWNARILRTLTERKGCHDHLSYLPSKILSQQFLTLMCERIDNAFKIGGLDGSVLMSLESKENNWWESQPCDNFRCFLVWNDVPLKYGYE